MDKAKYFVNFVISLLESCGLLALKHQAGSRARQHCDDSGRTYVVAATRRLEKCGFFLFFISGNIFYLGVIQVATILSSSWLNLHVQHCILCP